VNTINRQTVIPTVVVLTLFVIGRLADVFLYDQFWTASASMHSPPWYFVGRDFFSSITATLTLLATIGFLGATRKLYGPSYQWLLPVAIALVVPRIYYGLVILFRTRNLFDPKTASCPWKSYSEYAAESYFRWGLPVGLGVAVLFFAIFRSFGASTTPPPQSHSRPI